jgi:DNA (cytosine-5)-methyltransferase 1
MAMSYKLLDLFCGAGGCSVGYHEAGFEVTGVDIAPQPHYPLLGAFIQADALQFPLNGYDCIHASPPCQAYSKVTKGMRNAGKKYTDLLSAIRERLVKAGCHYVIENVPGAPLRNPVQLCGSIFGLGTGELELLRHRWFECSFALMVSGCQHTAKQSIGVYGNGTPSWHRKKLGRNVSVNEMRAAMGINWMVRRELSQAIPPAYTKYIGEQLIAFLEERDVQTN